MLCFQFWTPFVGYAAKLQTFLYFANKDICNYICNRALFSDEKARMVQAGSKKMKQWLKEFVHNCVVHPMMPFLPVKLANSLHDKNATWAFGLNRFDEFGLEQKNRHYWTGRQEYWNYKFYTESCLADGNPPLSFIKWKRSGMLEQNSSVSGRFANMGVLK